MNINILPTKETENKTNTYIEKEKVEKLRKYLESVISYEAPKDIKEGYTGTEPQKRHIKQEIKDIEKDYAIVKEAIVEGKNISLELRTKYELEILKREILQSSNQVRYKTEKFFQEREKTQPGVLRENGPSAKDINRKRLGDNGWTGRNLKAHISKAKNIALWKNIENNPEQFKKEFVEVQGDGKTYRETHQADIEKNVYLETVMGGDID